MEGGGEEGEDRKGRIGRGGEDRKGRIGREDRKGRIGREERRWLPPKMNKKKITFICSSSEVYIPVSWSPALCLPPCLLPPCLLASLPPSPCRLPSAHDL